MLQIKNFERKSFPVKAVQVTAENMEEVAEWCGGEIHTKDSADKSKSELFVKVPVHRPLNEKQTQAFVTDWVLQSPAGLKVYINRAFVKSFAEENLPPAGNVFENSPPEEIEEQPGKKAMLEAIEEFETKEASTMEKLGFTSARESKKVEL